MCFGQSNTCSEEGFPLEISRNVHERGGYTVPIASLETLNPKHRGLQYSKASVGLRLRACPCFKCLFPPQSNRKKTHCMETYQACCTNLWSGVAQWNIHVILQFPKYQHVDLYDLSTPSNPTPLRVIVGRKTWRVWVSPIFVPIN